MNVDNEKYYQFVDLPIGSKKLPNDIKRILSYGEHKFTKRYYFVSEKEKRVYRDLAFPSSLSIQKETPKSLTFMLYDDEDRRSLFTLNDKTMSFIHDNIELNIPKCNPWAKIRKTHEVPLTYTEAVYNNCEHL